MPAFRTAVAGTWAVETDLIVLTWARAVNRVQCFVIKWLVQMPTGIHATHLSYAWQCRGEHEIGECFNLEIHSDSPSKSASAAEATVSWAGVLSALFCTDALVSFFC